MALSNYGLKRYISEKIKLEVRQNSHFGCVICGNYIVQYHHLGDGFSEAKKHDPNEIILLCPTHHQQANKRISDAELRQFARKPFGQIHGIVFDKWTTNTERDIILGNCTFKRSIVPVQFFGAPLIWVDRPSHPGAPTTISAILRDGNGDVIGEIDRNVVSLYSNYYDIKCSGDKTTIRRKHGKIVLEFTLNSSEMNVRRWHGKTYGARFDFHHTKGFAVIVPSASRQTNFSGSTFDNLSGIAYIERPYIKVKNLPNKAGDISGVDGVTHGWLGEDKRIFNLKNHWVGIFDGALAWDLWPASPNEDRKPVVDRMSSWRRNVWGSLTPNGIGFHLLVDDRARKFGPVFAVGINIIDDQGNVFADNAKIIETPCIGQIGIGIGSFIPGEIMIPNRKEYWGERRGTFSHFGDCRTGF